METVAAHTAELQRAVFEENCFDGPLTAEHIHTHVDSLAALFVGLDLEPARTAALAAWAEAGGGKTVGFQQSGRSVVDAIATNLGWQLRCPAAALQSYYGIPCPP